MDVSRTSIFLPEFLRRISRREPWPDTASEAAWTGPWRVERRGRDEYAVVHEGEDRPEALACSREVALLLAAVFPACGRGQLFWLGESEEGGEFPFTLQTVKGAQGMDRAARLRYLSDELLVPLSTAEYFLRSPVALSYLLEAASAEVLRLADAELSRRAGLDEEAERIKPSLRSGQRQVVEDDSQSPDTGALDDASDQP